LRGIEVGAAVALGFTPGVALGVGAAGKASSAAGAGLETILTDGSARSAVSPAAEASSRAILPLIATRLAMTTSTVNPE